MKFTVYDPTHIEKIQHLFTKTFSDSEGQAEGVLIGDLAYNLLTRTNANDLYCFVAMENDNIIGSIIFSQLTFENKTNAFLLAPVAVDTHYQGKGVGQKLINFGINTLKGDGVEMIFTYGDPRFYTKVGFSPIDETVVKAPLTLSLPEGWLAQSLVSEKIEPILGNSHCVEALNKPQYW